MISITKFSMQGFGRGIGNSEKNMQLWGRGFESLERIELKIFLSMAKLMVWVLNQFLVLWGHIEVREVSSSYGG